ncbi:protein Spindly isoform X2 [Bradysia coprophila]|uniref:protein Spindly isoform X2 n=1 Tax=Bradysia coprophila TaxID=38358 RepID=UPI00187DAFC8|nr:protein Spindly isoform X2 [Bradysia coprophila]
MNCKSVDDLSVLSRESIIREYSVLYGICNELKDSEQRQLQEIHQLRRELQTALSDKNHLSSELEIINSEHAKDIEAISEKHREDLQESKDRLLACKDELERVESVRDELDAMVADLKRGGGEEKQIIATVPVDNNQSIYTEKITELEVENDDLAEAVESLKAELTDALKTNLQSENKIEDLMDRLRCAEENLESKRNELEEKNEMYETAQERVIELSGELNAIRMESDTAAKRGNSLFAEVDDQRQKMRALLVAQKANYIEMKNELEKCQQEVRKLKRENTAMYKEMEVCSHIFLNAEQHHTEKLNERITELMKENEAINKKLTFTEECLSEMVKKSDVKWLDPMVALCKSESNDLKDKLYRCSLQKVTIAGQLRQCEEESARWRFEALKSRCIIADRESLLEDNRIPFSAIMDIDRRVRKIDNENVAPNIGGRRSMLGFKRRSIGKLQSPQTNSKIAVDVNNVRDKVVADTKQTPPTDAILNSVGHMKEENELQKPLQSDIKLLQTDVKVEPVDEPEHEFKKPFLPNGIPTSSTESAEPNKTEKQKLLVPQPTDYSGVTMRKKMNLSTATPSSTATKNSSGILKPSSSPNIPTDRKVKFDDRTSTMKPAVDKTSAERKEDKVDNVPKTAIKKRIFIASKKPAK